MNIHQMLHDLGSTDKPNHGITTTTILVNDKPGNTFYPKKRDPSGKPNVP